jgi:hypothetical protein
MKNNYLVVGFFTAFMPFQIFAGDVGLGVSINSFDTAVYLPIRFAKGLILEPFISYNSGNIKSKPIEYGYSNSFESSRLDIGMGLFKAQDIIEKVNVYYGLRLSYIKAKSDDYYNGYVTSSTNTDVSGYKIAPTLGFNYSLTPDFLVGLEAEWFYSYADGKEKRYYENPENYIEVSDTEYKDQGTNTRVFVRYFF